MVPISGVCGGGRCRFGEEWDDIFGWNFGVRIVCCTLFIAKTMGRCTIEDEAWKGETIILGHALDNQ
jgi:hypothetical protein